MKTIWKFPLEERRGKITTPPVIRWLQAGVDPTGQPCVWAIVNPAGVKETHYYASVWTGEDMADEFVDEVRDQYLNTFITRGGLVNHFFIK